MELAKRIINRMQSMQAHRDLHVNTWQTCYDYTMPLRGQGFYDQTVSTSAAKHKKARITDNTATESLKVQAAQIVDGMTPANALWFLLDIGKESDDEKRWLHDAAKFIWENIHASNFDTENYESMLDLLIAGWFCLYIRESDDGGYEFQNWPISEVFIASTRRDKKVDVVHRKFRITAAQAVKEYGRDKLSSDIVKAFDDDKTEQQFVFIHAIEPRENFVVNARLAKNLPFRSIHIEEKSSKVVRESGYHEFPCSVPRWMVIPGSVYAVSPTYDALADIGMVNEIKRLELANLDLAIAGMWIAEDDGVLNPRTIQVGARKVIVANSVDSMKQLTSGTDFNAAFVSEDRVQAQIRKAFNADNLPPMEGQPRTALEISERTNMVRRIQGPIFGRFNSEHLQTVIERCFGIAFRAGVLGAPPESLANRSFNIKYISPLARAQKLEENNAIDQLIAGAANVSAAYPQVLDKINIDKVVDFKADALGIPADIVYSEDEVTEIRQRKAQAQQQAQQAAVEEELTVEAGKQAIAGAQ